MSTCKIILCCVLLGCFALTHAEGGTTKRVQQLSNERVKVWKTIIYPIPNQRLRMHRHDHDRVLVALTDGLLKITNNRGKIHYLTLKKNQSYYLNKDKIHELHTDENVSQHTIRVIVIELI